MREPAFWRGDAEGRDRAPMLQALLAPVSWLYAAAGAQRIAGAQPMRVSAPVICIGNLTLGGAGKTPVTRAIRARLGEGVCVLSRGYGGAARGPTRVTEKSLASDVGDEPLLHARDGMAFVARDRAAGAAAAIEAGARAILMDDGFQNPSLAKDLSIVVIDAGAWFGNGKVFPAGPLREPAAAGLNRADAVIVLHPAARANAGETDESEAHRDAAALLAASAKPILHAHIAASAEAPAGALVAFAGIARPEKFFDTLKRGGADIAESVPYPDHHAFSARDLDWLATLARERGAQLVTTEKDHVRLPAEWRARVAALPVIARFEDEAALDQLLAPIAARLKAGA